MAVIGVVAALTIPNFINKFERYRNAVALKRAYSDLQNYVDMFSYQNDCTSSFAECTPANHQFVDEFAQFLLDKGKFINIHNGQYALSLGTINSDGSKKRQCYNKGHVFCLQSNKGYTLRLYSYPHDNYYAINDRDKTKIRAGVDIYTDNRHVKLVGTDNPKVTSFEGKNVFTVNIVNNKRLVPHGSPLCYSNGNSYYCRPLTEDNCSKEKGKFDACMQRVINDGWEIKYDY